MYALPAIDWIASPNYSSRGGAKVRLVVVHDCEGGYAGAVSWFAQTRSQVSAHLVLREDGRQATQMVAYANKAWHACDFNSVSEGLEMGGYAAKGYEAPEWDAAAALVAWRLKVNGLKPLWAQKGEGEGFTSHYDLGKAGGGHYDPTTDSRIWASFVARVQAAYEDVPTASVSAAAPKKAPSAPAGFVPHGGMRHDFVAGSLEWAQAQLNALGVVATPLTVDGIDGLRTEAAVARYQQSRGLRVDGTVGPQTVAALQKDAA